MLGRVVTPAPKEAINFGGTESSADPSAAEHDEVHMRAEHLALDGSVVSIEADAELSTTTTATGWALVPSLMRAHPFTVYPPGHVAVIEQTMRSSAAPLEILSTEEYAIKNGKLRVGEVQLDAPTGGKRELTMAAWEGSGGGLHTAMVGRHGSRLVEVFDTLRFSDRGRGLAVDSPVVARPRAPEIVKEIPEIGILVIRPAIPSELEQVPKSRGFAVDHGELFRVRNQGRGLLFISNSTVVTVNPMPTSDMARVLYVVQRLRVEWAPRGSGSSAN